jgi:hypothetical protein
MVLVEKALRRALGPKQTKRTVAMGCTIMCKEKGKGYPFA